MCGIAGLIHRGKSSNVGQELQGMLQALRHRGEDSTGYALYGDTDGQNFIMRFKVGENVGEGSSSIMEDVSVYDERKKVVDQTLAEIGAKVIKEERDLQFTYLGLQTLYDRYFITHEEIRYELPQVFLMRVLTFFLKYIYQHLQKHPRLLHLYH